MVRARVARLQKDSAQFANDWVHRIFNAQSIYFFRLLALTFLLVVFGLLMVLSSSSIDSLRANNDAFYTFGRQIIWALLGTVGLVVASLMPGAFYHRVGRTIFGVGILLQVLVLLTPLGVSVNGNKAWLNLGPLGTMQPSEFIKLGLILVLGHLLSERQREIFDSNRYSYPAFFIGALAIGAIIGGKDMGTSMIVALIVFSMVWISGAPKEHFRLPLVITLAGIVGLVLSGGSRIGRVSAWLAGGLDDSANGYAWQSVHGIWALAAGGFQGVGLGASKMKWSWIPEVENDFIFAVIGEELGMIGAVVMILVFAFLTVTLFQIYQRCNDTFAKLVTLGVLCWISFQTAVNIAVVLQLLPVLGVPLPLISAGGSSLISGMVAVGVVLAFERENTLRLGPRPQSKNPRTSKGSAANSRQQPKVSTRSGERRTR